MQTVTKEELEKYIKSIGGLESGYGCKYWGDNKLRRFMFKVADWILWKLPYFKESKTFSKKNRVRLFFQNLSYWILKPILRDKKPKNPFRSKFYDTGVLGIGPGWYGIAKNLIQEAIEAGWNKEVCQVKEKFGGLRWYINGASKEVHDIISKYENMSYQTCEDCGSPGKPRNGGWIKTLCDNCNEEIVKK